MADDLTLGLDVGTSRIKACVVDLAGSVVAVSAVDTPFRTTADGTEMHPGEFLSAVATAIEGLGAAVRRVVAVGIATMGETGGFIAGGELVERVPLVAWHDRRGAETVRSLEAVFGDTLHPRTGRRIRTVSSIAKLGWLAAVGADLSGQWTGIGGIIAWALTGIVAQEASLAATTGTYDPFDGAWDLEIAAVAGLGAVAWPEVVRAGDPVGTVSPRGAAWSGLRTGVVVTIAGHDHPVGVVGVGASPDEVVDSLGTGEPLVRAWDLGRAELVTAAADIATIAGGDLTVTHWPGSARRMLLWECLRPGMARAFVSRLLGVDQIELDRDAAAAPPATAPISRARAECLEHDELPADLAPVDRSLWGSVLAGYAEATTVVERWMRTLGGRGSAADTVLGDTVLGDTVLIGGGLRSEAWVREKALRATRPLVRVDEREAVAVGAALLGGAAAGIWDRDALPRARRHAVRTPEVTS